MKKGIKSFFKGISFVALFLFIQVVMGVVSSFAGGIYFGATHRGFENREEYTAAYTEWFQGVQADLTTYAVFAAGVVTLLILFIAKKAKKRSFSLDMSVKKVSPGLLGKATLFGAGLNATVVGILGFLPDSVMDNYAEASSVFSDSMFIPKLLATVVAAPLIEEIIFRGGLYKSFRGGMP